MTRVTHRAPLGHSWVPQVYLDHHTRWPTGQTTVCNLCSYCRTHHRLKHLAPGWTRYDDRLQRIILPARKTIEASPAKGCPLG